MHNFLAQFTGLTEAQKLRFESFIFSQASGMIVGYNGGSWASVKCGEVWGLVIPGKWLSVTINTPFGGSSTANNESASIAFTMLVNNWFWNLLAEQEQCTQGIFRRTLRIARCCVR
jgi:hypothetical protein